MKPLKKHLNSDFEDDHWYYARQLMDLKDLTQVNIKLTDFNGNSTKSMSLSPECIDVLIDWLQEYRQELNNKGDSHE